jgi:hypothetical protein
MRLLPDIRYGTERYPEKVARRLRTHNIGTWIAAASCACFAGLAAVGPKTITFMASPGMTMSYPSQQPLDERHRAVTR